MPRFVVCVYHNPEGDDGAIGAKLPIEVMQCRFVISIDEAKHLYPFSIRSILKIVLRSLADSPAKPNEGTELDAESFYLALKIPLVDVLEAVDTLFSDWDGDLGDVEVWLSPKEISISEDEVMGQDYRLSFGTGDAVFDNYRCWLSSDVERNRSLGFYYHIFRSKSSGASPDNVEEEAEGRATNRRQSKRLSLGERALKTLGLSAPKETEDEAAKDQEEESPASPPVVSMETKYEKDDCLIINLISDAYLPDRGVTCSLHSLKHLVDVNHWPYVSYVFNLSQGEVTWKITKRYSQFHSLHTNLYHQAIQSDSERESDALRLEQLPKMPEKNSLYSRYDSRRVVDERKQELVDYLQALIDATRKRPNYILMRFLGMVGGPGAGVAGNGGVEDTHDSHGSGTGTCKESNTGSSRVHILQLVAEVETGDIILFQSKSNMSTLQRQATGSKWDHVGIVVRRPRTKHELKRILFKERYERLRIELERSGMEKGSEEESNAMLERLSRQGGASVADDDEEDNIQVPITSFLDQELCLLEATGDGVTITPLVERIQAYATYDVCHTMAVRKLRPLIPTGFTIDESDEEDEGAKEKEGAIGGLGDNVDEEGKEDGDAEAEDGNEGEGEGKGEGEEEGSDDESARKGTPMSVRRGTLGLGFLMGAEEKLRVLSNFNEFLLSVENSPYGLTVADLFSRKRLAGKEGEQGVGKSTSQDEGDDGDDEDDGGWRTYDNGRTISGESEPGFVVEPPSPRSRKETTRTTMSASEMFPGLEQRTFFCSALAAAALKALGIISNDLNDNYFWPGAFAQGNEIDEEAKLMSYCFTTEAIISTDIPAISKLVQVSSHNAKNRLAMMNSWKDEDDDEEEEELRRPGILMQFT